jgi:methionine-rich copper-binding protein CopC
MGSPDAWCSAASPDAMPPIEPHEGVAQNHGRSTPMTAATGAHATVIAATEPAEITVGDKFVLAVRVSCPAGCDLSRIPIEVAAPDGATIAVAAAAGDTRNGSERRVALVAPSRDGEHDWRVSCAAHDSGGHHHDASQSLVPVRIRPHDTSLAVWAIPSPVVTGQAFAIKVGAKSTAGYDLASMRIAVCDEAGTELASGTLGATPWPGTSALYWRELTLTAPAEAGMYSWTVRFDAADMALAHRGASSRFSIAIVRPPEHRLTVKVIEHASAAPIENALVRLGAYRAATGGSGVAEFMLPKGAYDLDVWKSGYEAPTTPVVIDADLAVDVAITAVPEENPDAAWQM